MSCQFLTLPGEVLTEVFKLAPTKDLLNIRSVCKDFEKNSFDSFAKGFFTSRHHSLSKRGLRRLKAIASHEGLGAYIRKVMFKQEKSDSLRSVSHTRELHDSLIKLAFHGNRVTIGIEYGMWDYSRDEYEVRHSQNILGLVLRLVRETRVRLESFVMELCHHESWLSLKPITIRRANVNQSRLMDSLMEIVESSYNGPQPLPNIDWIVQFARPSPLCGVNSNPAHIRARFCYNHAERSFHGESFSVLQFYQISNWFTAMDLSSLTISYADVAEWSIKLLLHNSRETLRKIDMHSVSIYKQRYPNSVSVDGTWADVLQQMRALDLEEYSLAFLYEGFIAFSASALVTKAARLVPRLPRHKVSLGW